MITLEQAIAIAEQKAIELKLGFEISHVISYDDIKHYKPKPYGLDITNCWIAYVDTKELVLDKSTYIAIDRNSGLVVTYGTTF